jgi:DNA-binding NarL/FixJ family response regulator
MTHVVVTGSRAAHSAAVGALPRDAHIVDGWDGEAGSVCVGVVASPADAERVALAAMRGAAVIVSVPPTGQITELLVDDLRRLGGVTVVSEEPAASPQLTPDERALLQHLAEGLTLGVAAAALHIGRRTADRRLASARTKLGASSTAEAVVRFSQL